MLNKSLKHRMKRVESPRGALGNATMQIRSEESRSWSVSRKKTEKNVVRDLKEDF